MALPQVVLPTYELEIPSNGKKIKYRPFVVKEEKLLLLALETNDEKQIEDAVRNLLKGCIQSRVKIDDLAIFDLEYIFLQIRAVSVGEIVEMNLTCEDDGKTVVTTGHSHLFHCNNHLSHSLLFHFRPSAHSDLPSPTKYSFSQNTQLKKSLNMVYKNQPCH